MGVPLQIKLLGPVLVRLDGVGLPVHAPQMQGIVAILAARSNAVVTRMELIEALWGDLPPSSAENTLHVYVARLRRLLEPDRVHRAPARLLVSTGAGYLLRLEPEQLDVELVETHRDRAHRLRTGGDLDGAARSFDAALALWRGTAWSGVPGPFAQVERNRLGELWLMLFEERAETMLALGRHRDLVGELSKQTAEHPLQEHLRALLMQALHRSGRRAEALQVFRDTRAALIDELGIEPGSELVQLHQRILAADSALVPSRVAAPVPVQLPADVANFTDREQHLADLHALLDRHADTGLSSPVICAIAGTAGVGKTALAVHWGRGTAASFPDGCLYVDLRGYDPDEPLDPGAALASFLRALGMDGGDIPYEPTERAARYRTLLEGRRMLIVLDNARDTEQVRPLLPGAASCFVVVTSRDSLAGLVARHGAHRIDLDLLPPHDAVALLRKLIGARVDENPHAAGTLAAHCARLPLALRIAAELAVARPTITLDDLAGELADEHRQLELLDAGNDSRTAVRSVFSWSYKHLAADAARLFRLLGLHPGLDVNPEAAGALADIAADQARRLLDLLATAHLVQRTAPHRYRMHDLLRAWTREQTQAIDTEPDRRAALTRLFDFYLLSASAAIDLLYPHDRHRRARTPIPATVTITISDEDTARRWLDAERANLLAIGAHTATNEWRIYAIQLSSTLHRHLTSIADATSALSLHEHALAAALHHGDRAALAWTLTNLAATHSAMGQFEQANDLQQWALTLHRDTGDRAGQARALTVLGTTYWRAGRYEPAIDHLHQALASYRDIGDTAGEARALLNLGATCWHSGHYKQSADHFLAAQALFCDLNISDGHVLVYGRTGRQKQAIQHLQQAVALARDIDDHDGQADALTYLGEVYNRISRHERAATCHREALQNFGDCGNQSGLATASNGLGETACAAGDPIEALRAHQQAHDHADAIGDRPQLARAHAGIGHAHHLLANADQARAHWLQAHTLYDKLDLPEAAEIRTHLTAIDNLPETPHQIIAEAPREEQGQEPSKSRPTPMVDEDVSGQSNTRGQHDGDGGDPES